MSQVFGDNFVIRTRIEIDSNVQGLVALQKQAETLEKTLKRVAGTRLDVAGSIGMGGRGGGFGGLFGGADGLAGQLRMLAGGAGVGMVTRGMVGLQTETQNAQIGLASLISTMTTADIGDSMLIAREQLKGLREDAAKGAGELSDYTTAFQQILGPAMAAGASLERVRSLNSLALNAGFAMRGQEGLQYAPLDVVQALTAGVTDRTTPIVSTLLRALNVSNDSFNKMDGTERLATLEKAFGQMEAGAKLMGKSWDAQMATLKDNVKDLLRSVGEPIFNHWSEDLAEANDWLSKNRDVMREMAFGIGDKLERTFSGIEQRAGTLAGLGTAGAVLPGVGRMASAGLAGAGVGGLASAGLVGGLMATLSVGIMSIQGAIGESPKLATDLAAGLGALSASLVPMMDAFGAFFQPGSPFNLLGRRFMEDAARFAQGAALLINVVSAFTTHWADTATALATMSNGIPMLLKGDLAGAGNQLALGKNMQAQADIRFAARLFGALNPSNPDDPLAAGAAGLAGKAPVPETKVTNNFNGPMRIEIKTEQLDDPNRVAGAFQAIIAKLHSQPIESKAQRLTPRAT